MTSNPKVIAHRGYIEKYPENTLPALEAAIRAGADGVELDVQFCRDATPIVLHDEDLLRTTGRPGTVMDMEPADLAGFSAHEPERFGDRFGSVPIPTLRQAAEHLAALDAGLVFVEIKEESLPMHDLPRRVQNVIRACEPLGDRAVIISFSEEVIRVARSLSKLRAGWVLSQWTIDEMERAEVLEPDYLFVNAASVPPPPAPLWPGRWEWVAYEVNDPKKASSLGKRGFHFIETAAVETLVEALRQH